MIGPSREGEAGCGCGSRCQATVRTLLSIKTLTFPRVPRATWGHSRPRARQGGPKPSRHVSCSNRPLPSSPCPPFYSSFLAHKALELHLPPLIRKYLLSIQMHLNELLRWAVGNLAMFVSLTAPLEFTLVDEKLLERSHCGL